MDEPGIPLFDLALECGVGRQLRRLPGGFGRVAQAFEIGGGSGPGPRGLKEIAGLLLAASPAGRFVPGGLDAGGVFGSVPAFIACRSSQAMARVAISAGGHW